MWRLCAALMTTVVVGAPVAAQNADEEAERTRELELIAATVWQAVVGRDAETLLRYASPSVDVASVRAPLAAANSTLAAALWKTSAGFFVKHPHARLRIAFMGMPEAFGMKSRLDLAVLAWVVPGSDADRNFPAHDLGRWGVDHVTTCMIYGATSGWRFHSDVGVLFCAGTLPSGSDAAQ
jgi:hypothetical protein